VEDEDDVRTAVAGLLRADGHTVLEAADGEAALPIARETRALDLVISDTVMPRTGGRALAAELRVFRPEVPILLTSGYMEDETVTLASSEAGLAFLQKPFTPEALLLRVQELLSR
jgi:CheY-like chemotaxis protein